VRSKYRIISMMAILVLCLILYLFLSITGNQIRDIYSKTTHDAIYDLKKAFIQDTVNNQIKRIDMLVELETGAAERQVKELEVRVEKIRATNPPMEAYVAFFRDQPEMESMDVVIWSADESQVLFDPKGLIEASDFPDVTAALSGEFASWRSVKARHWVLMYGVARKVVHDRVKETVAREIHDAVFAENSYLWVNEVVDYSGGDRYAIRRIHPNLPETEGSYLSTAMTDIKGNFPYLEELNGVKASGEIFFTYYFKKKDSEVVSEKLAYAKLYKPFNWIVSMGIHLDDTNQLVDLTTERGRKLAEVRNRLLFGLMASVLSITIIFLLALEHWVFRKSRKVLEDRINLDQLTGAMSRVAGERDLSALRVDLHRNKVVSAVCMFDIDFFKRINDTHGHDMGDMVLQGVAQRVRDIVRTTDRLYRWGGDEFLLICPGVEKEKAEGFFNRIRAEIAHAGLVDSGGNLQVTVSMGVSYVSATDRDFQDVVKRADVALYHAKECGRNTVMLEL